jgi:hypothetical protein
MKATKRGFETVVLSTFMLCVVTVSGLLAGGITIGPNATNIGRVVIVSPSPGDTVEANGTALLNALAGITNASASEPYLLKLGPGNYYLGTSSLQMKEFVDIEGSGEETTVIGGTNGNILAGVVRGANYAELRFLAVHNSGPGYYVTGVCCVDVSPRMTNVAVVVSGGVYNYGVYSTNSALTMTNVTAQAVGTNTNYAVYNNNCSRAMTMTNVTATSSGGAWNMGVYNDSSQPMMTNVDASALGGSESYGVYNDSSSPYMINVRAVAAGAASNYAVYNQSSAPLMTGVIASGNTGTYSYGLYNSASSGTYTIKIDQSSFEGLPNSIYNDSEYTLYIGASKLRGPVNSAGTYHCVGVYADTTYTVLGPNCQ